MKLIKLANGETLELNINFLTLKLIMDMKLFDNVKEDKEGNPTEQFDIAGKLIYAIMYSNGKKVTEEEALALVPIGDGDAFFDLFNEFQTKMEEFKKKAESRMNLEKVAK